MPSIKENELQQAKLKRPLRLRRIISIRKTTYQRIPVEDIRFSGRARITPPAPKTILSSPLITKK